MLFTSGLFLFLYLPITLTGFFALAKFLGIRAAGAWLAFMSFFFYGYWAATYLLLLIGSITMNYVGGLLIYQNRSQPIGKIILATYIAMNLIILGYFKYYNFFSEILINSKIPIPALDIVLPIGISFFTFTQIAFLVDTYQGKVKEFQPIHYALFVTYFPHLIAGPILHHAEMMPQFANSENYHPQIRKIALGTLFFTIGMVKKVLFADSISSNADNSFTLAQSNGRISFIESWQGALSYTLQIYFDFSGYSDMAIGLSLLFGIKLPTNFSSPYKSTNIIDFWRRWHMTLSRFLRDYLYIALGGNRLGPVRRYINLAITMLLGGLWHGAAWTFVIWGALHGAYLMINHGWRSLTSNHSWAQSRAASVIAWFVTMTAVIVAWVFFRAESIQEAINMLTAMAGFTSTKSRVDVALWVTLSGMALIALTFPNSQQIVTIYATPYLERMTKRQLPLIFGMIGSAIVIIVWLALITASRANSSFIYFNF